MNLLLDTNIWLDYFFPERSGHADAMHLIEESIKHDASLFYAVTTAKDVFFLTCAILKRRMRTERPDVEPNGGAIQTLSWGFIETMRELATPVGVDDSDLWLAGRYRSLHGDLEDNLIIAAAKRSDAGILVTGDAKLIAHAPVAALSALDAVRLIVSAEDSTTNRQPA